MLLKSNNLVFGDLVLVNHKLVRKDEAIHGRHAWNKFWKKREYKDRKTGILIGFRTLANGELVPCGEDGLLFRPKEYIKVALVVLNQNTNPVYVALDGIENEVKNRRKK